MPTPSTRPTVLAVLRSHFRSILLRTAVVAALIFAATFLIRDKFTASTVLLPPNFGADLGSLLPGVTGALPLGKALGLDTGGGTDVYVGVLRSQSLGQQLVERFGLIQRYKAKDREKAQKQLDRHTLVQLTNEGFVRVSVTEPDRQLAADLANAYIEGLDRFLRTSSNSGARRRREFLERRLTDVRDTLALAEDRLRDFQVLKRMPAAGTGLDRSAAAASDLMAQKVSREIELGTLETVTRQNNPRSEELRNELRQINGEIVKIPPATTDLGRLYREVSIQERVLLVLTEEYERARVMELKDIPTVEVVDRATPPLHKSQPHRALIAAASFMIVFAANGLLVCVREGVLSAG